MKKFDSEMSTAIIRGTMECFLEDSQGHIQDAQEYVTRDPEDIFHINLIQIFGAAREEFTTLFADYLNGNEELSPIQNQFLADKLVRFAERYKAKEGKDIIYKLLGEMLESRIDVIFEDEENCDKEKSLKP